MSLPAGCRCILSLYVAEHFLCKCSCNNRFFIRDGIIPSPACCLAPRAPLQGGTGGTRHTQYFYFLTLSLWALHGKNGHQKAFVPLNIRRVAERLPSARIGYLVMLYKQNISISSRDPLVALFVYTNCGECSPPSFSPLCFLSVGSPRGRSSVALKQIQLKHFFTNPNGSATSVLVKLAL